MAAYPLVHRINAEALNLSKNLKSSEFRSLKDDLENEYSSSKIRQLKPLSADSPLLNTHA